MNELKHHGIRGQKWGVKHGPPYPLSEGTHSRVTKGGKSSSKSSRPSGSGPSSSDSTVKKKKGLSDRQKTAIKVGAALAVTALAAYGGYKLYQSGALNNLVNKGKDAIARKTGMSSGTRYYATPNQENLISTGNKWMSKLSRSERSAMERFVTSDYQHTNGYLRRLKGDTRPGEIGRIKKMDSAISKFKLKDQTTFTRFAGSQLLGDGPKSEAEIRKMIGKTVHDPGFMSASAASSSLWKRYQEDPRYIKYEILTPPGKGIGAYIRGFSNNPTENEFLFARGSDFQISDVTRVNGQIVVSLLYKGVRKASL